jgi:anthranilate phosphoribosyltransferase
VTAPVDLASLRRFLERLLDGDSLQESEAALVLQALTQSDLPPALAGAILAASRAKGLTAAELRGFAGAMRSLARRPVLADSLQASAIDIVGTGGDASGSFNLSTGAALLTERDQARQSFDQQPQWQCRCAGGARAAFAAR